MTIIEKYINQDMKFLLRFLKEKHIFKEYQKKFGNISAINNFTSYNNWLNFIKENLEEYCMFDDDSLNDENKYYVFNNDKLISSEYLFSLWSKMPFVLNDDIYIESHTWEHYCSDFVTFKYFYYKTWLKK